jgi:glycosyltransferase involved in cell wall biosynthesis
MPTNELIPKDKPMPKTVLQVLPSLVSGGVETGTLDLARELVKQGYRSVVISSGGPLVKMLKEQGTEHLTLPVHSKNPFLIWLNSRRIRKIIEKENIDLVHARSRAPAWSCLWATRNKKTPFITTFHGVYGHQNKLKRWYNSAMLRSDHTIAVSHYVENHIRDTYPHLGENVSTILRGIDLNSFKLEEAKFRAKNLRSEWNISPESKIIMLPGRLTRIKGHRILIEALSKLTRSDFFCLFVGDEPGKEHYKQELISLIQEKNLQDKVKFTGNCNDMASAYLLADVVISASIKPESFGRVACEAQLMHRLVVATDHGGSQETISPCLRRYMCKPNDAQSMADAISKALSLDEQEQIQIGDSAAEYVRKNFSLEKMCQDTISLYNQILSRPTK